MVYCPSCGEQVNTGAKFCPNCGALVQQESSKESQMNEEVTINNQSATKMKRRVKEGKKPFFKPSLFLGIIALFIIASSVGAVLLLKKSPKELYLYSEYKTYQQSKEDLEEQYEATLAFQEELLNRPSSSKMSLSGNMEGEAFEGDEDVEMIRDLLSQASLTMSSEQDPTTQEGHYTLAFNLDGEKSLGIEMTQTESQIGVKIPLLYEKFFYLNFDEYGEFMRMLDPEYEGSDTLDISELDWETLKLSEDDQQYLADRYSQFLLDSLKEENFTLQKGVEYEYNGETMKVRKLTLSLSPAETKQFMEEFLQTIIADKEMHTMLVDRVVTLTDSLDLTEEMNLDKSEMKKELISGLEEIKEGLDELTFEQGYTSTLFINKKEQIIDRQVKMTIGDEYSKTNVVLNTKDVPYGDDQQFEEFTVQFSDGEDESTRVELSITNDSSVKKDNRTENLKVNFNSYYYGELDQGITLAVDSDVQGKDGSKQEILRTYHFTMDDGYGDEPTEFSGTIKQTNDVNMDEKYANNKVEFALSLADEGTFSIVLDSETKLLDSLKIPAFDTGSSDALNIVDLTEEEMYRIFEEEILVNLDEILSSYGLSMEDLFSEDDYYYEDEDFYYDENYYFEDEYYEDEAYFDDSYYYEDEAYFDDDYYYDEELSF